MPKPRPQAARNPTVPVPRPTPRSGRGRTAPRRSGALGRVAPLLRLPAGRFTPPHCPNRLCAFYEPSPLWPYSHWGIYHAPSCPKPLPRFQCRTCRRTFTARSFAVTYWLHHWDLFACIASLSVAGSGLRQMARSLGVSHATVARHLTRAARCCLIRHRHLLERAALREPIAIDGFESFEHSQFFPYHANLAAGRESWFLYHFTDSPLRRKGKMTAEQKRRRAELESKFGRPDPKAVENGVLELLREIVRLVRTPRKLHPDHSRRVKLLETQARRLRSHDFGRAGAARPISRGSELLHRARAEEAGLERGLEGRTGAGVCCQIENAGTPDNGVALSGPPPGASPNALPTNGLAA